MADAGAAVQQASARFSVSLNIPTSTDRSVRSSSKSMSNSPNVRVAAPVRADHIRTVEVRQHVEVEEFGASRLGEDVETLL